MKISKIVDKLESYCQSMDLAQARIDIESVSINSFTWESGSAAEFTLDEDVQVFEIDRMPTDMWIYMDKDIYIEVLDELKSIQESKTIDREAIQQRLDQATKLIGEAYRLLEGDQL